MKVNFSICTPVYNRAHLLYRLYDSLVENLSQNYKFEWILIDDGSSTDVQELDNFVKRVGNSEQFEFTFIRKENGGKHTCLNLFFEKAQGELLLILDSDDALAYQALERVNHIWQNNKSEDCAGVIGHCIDIKTQTRLGDNFPYSPMKSTILNNNVNLKLAGDRCDFVRTDLLKEQRFPVYDDECFMPEAVVMVRPDASHYYICVNEDFKLIEYQEGGLSDSYQQLSLKNPRGMKLRYEVVLNDPRLLGQLHFIGKLKYFTNFFRYSYYSGGFSELIKSYKHNLAKGWGIASLSFLASLLLIIKGKI